MRVAIVGGGLAGLATAAGLTQSGHEVSVIEQADGLRAGGLALNLWSNATTLLPRFGIPPEEIPGEPVSAMTLRANGRQVAVMSLPARGLPHVNVERAPLLHALARTLPPGAVTYGVRRDDLGALATDNDLVVLADGANSALRSELVPAPRKRWSWPIWQACIDAELPEVPPGTGAAVVRSGLFSGIWRLPGRRVTWFVEQPSRAAGTGRQLLQELTQDKDPALRALAAATHPDDWVEWRAQDTWPASRMYRDNVVLVGDAAHAMLPTLGQGACQALQDAAELTHAISTEDNLTQALRRYQRRRLHRTRVLVALARAGAVSRRSSAISRAIPEVLAARALAATSAPIMRRLTSPAKTFTDA